MRTILAIVLLLVSAVALAELPEHPFARRTEPADLDLSFGRLEWGRTTLSYSQSWLGGGQSYSQAMLLKDLRAPLAEGLEFMARFGLAYTPGGALTAAGEQAELVIPFAALQWQPGDNFLLRLEYSQPGRGSFLPYGSRGGAYGDPFAWSPRSLAPGEESEAKP